MLIVYNDHGYARIGLTQGESRRDPHGHEYVGLRSGGAVYRADILAGLNTREAWILQQQINAVKGDLMPWEAVGWLEAYRN